VLVLHNQGGLVEVLAEAITAGVGDVPGTTGVRRTPQQVAREDFLHAEAIIIGLDAWRWIGAQGTLRQWFSATGDLWERGLFAGKVGAAFTASTGRGSQTDSTLLAIIHWQLSRGMVIVGPPWTERMAHWGPYYGAIALGAVTADDLARAHDLGRHVAELTLRLRG
jgi:multimeric flavodoxin WrbA